MWLTDVMTRENDWVVARCVEAEVASQGRAVEETLNNLKEALEPYFDDNPDAQVTPPLIIAPIEVSV